MNTPTTTISNKMTKIVMLTCTSVILLTLVIAVVIQGTNLRNSMIDKMSTLAKVIGETSKKSLDMGLKYQAAPILSTLKTEPTIEAAYLFDRHDHLFAQYINRHNVTYAQIIQSHTFKPEELRQAQKNVSPIYEFSLQNFRLYAPVIHKGEYLGAVYLQASLNPILADLLWFVISAMVMLLVALMVAYLMTIRLQPLVITPLQKLVKRMRIVTEDKIYDLEKQPELHNNIDEINELQAGFDEMLSQINKRQEKLQQYSEVLEDQVMSRTHDLQQSNEALRKTINELDIARKEAVEASAAKSRFLANMSHEIRTPMIGVLGMAELLLKNTTDSYQRELTLTIHNSGESLLAILNDLLDISKIEAGKLELEHNSFNPVETLESAVELLADNAISKGLEITTIPDPYIPEIVIGDAERLRQIILNLLSNAIKFTAQGQISLSMHSTPLTESTIELYIDVCDSGIGISEQAKNKIFTAFTQADSSTTRNYGGTGLGLTIVNQLVELMGGNIVITDRIPNGSCFKVRVILNTATQHNRENSFNKIANNALIITNSTDLKNLLTAQLTAAGINTRFASSPKQIQQELNDTTHPIDIIFIDPKEPSHNESYPFTVSPQRENQPKIVAITHRNDTPTKKRQQQLGISHIITKPVKVKDLKDTVLEEISQEPCIVSSPEEEAGEKIQQADKSNRPHILLAEDNPTNQRLAQLILEQQNYQLTIVTNGEQAVEATENTDFDLILMDCQMPVMDGYSATKEIRGKHTTPIIALTAHVSDTVTQQCTQAGMNAYLCKPYKQQQLIDIVEEFTAKHNDDGINIAARD